MPVRRYEPTPEDSEEISKTVKFISMALAIRGTSKEIGICSLCELLVLAYADMAQDCTKEETEQAYDALINNLTLGGKIMIDHVYNNKKKKDKPQLDEIVELFKGVKPNER